MGDDRMLLEPVRQMMKDYIGITDEDLDKVSPGIAKLLNGIAKYDNLKWNIIAEVTDSKYCFAGCKVGDKFVFDNGGLILNAEKSTCPFCIGAIGPMLERVHIMWERASEGLDPNDIWVKHSQCYDPGLEHGGLGRVVFKVYAEKVEG